MFTSAYLLRPEDLHEIAGLGLIEVVEISAEPEFMKEPGSAGPVCVPATPNSFAVTLIADDELVEGCEVKMKLAACTERLNCPDEHLVSCSGAEARKRRRRQNEKFSRLEMRRGLQSNLGKSGDGVTAALWHLSYLLQDDSVEVLSRRSSDANREKRCARGDDYPKHAE